jgi:hypothetical protein
MTVAEEQLGLENVFLEAERGGNRKHYENLLRDLEDRKDRWKAKDEGGDFSPDELSSLIEKYHHAKRFVESELATRGD